MLRLEDSIAIRHEALIWDEPTHLSADLPHLLIGGDINLKMLDLRGHSTTSARRVCTSMSYEKWS